MAVGAMALLFLSLKLKQPGIHEQTTLPGRLTELQPWDNPFVFEADTSIDPLLMSRMYADNPLNSDITDWLPYDSVYSDALGREWLGRATEAPPSSTRTRNLSEFLAVEPITEQELECLESTGRA